MMRLCFHLSKGKRRTHIASLSPAHYCYDDCNDCHDFYYYILQWTAYAQNYYYYYDYYCKTDSLRKKSYD